MGTSVTIGSIGCVEFIAASNPSKVSVRGDGIVDRKREVPGNTEDVFNTNVMQARENVLYYRCFHTFLRLLRGIRHSVRTAAATFASGSRRWGSCGNKPDIPFSSPKNGDIVQPQSLPYSP